MAGRDSDLEDGEETGTFGPFSSNDRTIASYLPSSGDLTPKGPREAFFIAYDRLAELAMAAKKPSLAIGVVDGKSRLVCAELLETGGACTIGRHTKCRIRLPSEVISLRHIVALALPGEFGSVALRVWDLNTRLPFRSEDGEPQGAIASDGPTYLTLGPFALWFLPCGPGLSWPERGVDAYAQMPPRSIVDRRAPVPPERRAGVTALPKGAQRGGPYRGFEEHTRITTHAPPLLLGDEEEPEVAWGTIRLQSGGSKAKRKVSAERLEQGLLVGRYERCGLSIGEIDRNVSRVHLLLVRIGAEVWAIDTGSTNGVRKDGRNIEAIVLDNAARLEFGSGMVLDWTKLDHPEA